MKLRIFSLLITAYCLQFTANAQSFNFSFDGRDKTATKINADDVFTPEKGYGYDFQNVIDEARKQQREESGFHGLIFCLFCVLVQ